MDKKMEKALGKQLNAELYSSYLYLAMAGYFHSVNLNGFASWMRVQAMEELTHARRFFAFLVDRQVRVVLSDIQAPPSDWKSPKAVFEEAYAHEKKVTAMINELVSLSWELKDFATQAFLQFFVNEQVEEESSIDAVLQSLNLVENQASGWFLIDKDLATRSFLAPVGLTI